MITDRSSVEFLTVPEIARLLRTRESKVISWIRSGRLPAANISDGRRPRYRIRRSDLDEFLRARAAAPTAARPAARQRRSNIPQYV